MDATPRRIFAASIGFAANLIASFHPAVQHAPMRHALRLTVTSLLVMLALVFSLGAGFKTSDEKIPEAVRKEIGARIKKAFGGAKLAGVPLLDPSVDWNDFSKWPESFEFDGKRFEAEYSYLGSDYIGRVRSRSELRSDHGIFLKYSHPAKSTNGPPANSFVCVWSKHGYVKEKGLDWGGTRIFLLQFYPSGDLSSFQRDEHEVHHVQFYHSGALIGSLREGRFTFREREVSVDEFYRRLSELTKGMFPPEA
jgi:hypothetical protein